MKFEFERTPLWLRLAIPFFLWKKSSKHRRIYLTFDDGPTPEVTGKILDILAEHQIAATFFMLGQNVDRHPELARRVQQANHSIGNHGYEHLSGWANGLSTYLRDVKSGRTAIDKQLGFRTRMFRPPYGQIGPLQGYCLWWLYKIVMWDVVSLDYREDLSASDVEGIVIKHACPGSIVLMHDSVLAAPRTLTALPTLIEHFKKQNYTFAKL